MLEVAKGVVRRPNPKSIAQSKPVIATHKLKIDIPAESPKSSSKSVKASEKRKTSLPKRDSQQAERNISSVSPTSNSPRVPTSPKTKYPGD